MIGLFAAIFLATGGIVYHQYFARTRNTAIQKSLRSDGNTLSQTDEIPGSELQAQPAQNLGLSVENNSSGTSLGQLGPSQDGEPAPRQQSKSPFDPSTFSEYEKYKDEPNAYFSEAQAGTGAELTNGMKAAVLYKGWLTNGTMFDMSRANEKGELQPFIFTLGEHKVILGWEQALAGMKVGGVRLLIIPPAVGYGSQGQGNIPPNSVLVFQVQLLDVQ